MKTGKKSGVRSLESGVKASGFDSGLRTPDSRLFESVYERLRAWCRARGYAGHDPFDALSSRLFRATPLRRSRLAPAVGLEEQRMLAGQHAQGIGGVVGFVELKARWHVVQTPQTKNGRDHDEAKHDVRIGFCPVTCHTNLVTPRLLSPRRSAYSGSHGRCARSARPAGPW